MAPDNTIIGESSWIKLSVRSAIAVVVAIIVGTSSAIFIYVSLCQKAAELSAQMIALKSSTGNLWTVPDMKEWGRQSRSLNWSLVRQNDPQNPSGFIAPDARQIHQDNQL